MDDSFAWRKKKIIVKFKDLNPAVQDIVKSNNPFMKQFVHDTLNTNDIRSLRIQRGFFDSFTLLGLYGLIPNNYLKIFMITPFWRHRLVKEVQSRHKDLLESINKYGLLQTTHERNYPRDWIKPDIVEQTHPIFYVKGNGDLVFIPRGRTMEYYRMLFQKSKMGKLGLNAWRWRVYLKPITAPQKVREWARSKLNLQLARVPTPATIPVRSLRFRNQLPKRRRTRIP